jgi:hypothetical protein
MGKSRILNIEHMLQEAFLQALNHEQMLILMGQDEEQDYDKYNDIIIMFCDNGTPSLGTIEIKTDIPDVVDINYLVVQCLIESGLMFDSLSARNLDGSKLDMSNIKKGIALTVHMTEG